MDSEKNTIPVCCRVGVLFRSGESSAWCRPRYGAREPKSRESEMIIAACPGYEYGGWRGIGEGA